MTQTDTPSPPEAAAADLRSRIQSYLTTNGEGTAEGMATAFKLTEAEVDACLQHLVLEREVFHPPEDLDGLIYCPSFRWRGDFTTMIPGEFEGVETPLAGITLIAFRSQALGGDPFDDRHVMTPAGYMVEVNGTVHRRIFADPAKAVVAAIALQYVADDEADWAATAFFKIIGRTYPAIRD